ncbi:hypothetical protein CR513_46021, partial [Mucuna pruriens]
MHRHKHSPVTNFFWFEYTTHMAVCLIQTLSQGAINTSNRLADTESVLSLADTPFRIGQNSISTPPNYPTHSRHPDLIPVNTASTFLDPTRYQHSYLAHTLSQNYINFDFFVVVGDAQEQEATLIKFKNPKTHLTPPVSILFCLFRKDRGHVNAVILFFNTDKSLDSFMHILPLHGSHYGRSPIPELNHTVIQTITPQCCFRFHVDTLVGSNSAPVPLARIDKKTKTKSKKTSLQQPYKTCSKTKLMEYAYLDNHQHFRAIIANNLNREQEEKLLNVLEKLVGKSHYYFLDGFSGYMQIHITPVDQHKMTFTYPFGTFAYTWMSFGLCNASSTFQRCMISIFSDLLEDCMEIFMNDFTVYAESFEACLENLSQQDRPALVQVALERCGLHLRLALRGSFPGPEEVTYIHTDSPGTELGVSVQADV